MTQTISEVNPKYNAVFSVFLLKNSSLQEATVLYLEHCKKELDKAPSKEEKALIQNEIKVVKKSLKQAESSGLQKAKEVVRNIGSHRKKQ